MQADKTTLADLSIFSSEEDHSVFHALNFTETNGGRDYLRQILGRPLSSTKEIRDTQKTIQHLLNILPKWKSRISNGTIMVAEKFFETQLTSMPKGANIYSAYIYKWLNASDYGICRYSVEHFVHLLQGMQEIHDLLYGTDSSIQISLWLQRIGMLLNKPGVHEILTIDNPKKIGLIHVLEIASFMQGHYKQAAFELIDIFSKIDAYLSMAKACKHYQLCFPEVTDAEEPSIIAEQLYHLLLPTPVSYDVQLNRASNFLFLTGANMAGKSTFIKAVGVGVYLAQLGMGVPAKSMRISFFDGLLSNIHVMDNIVKGESYFFNEVQRIRKTIEKISDGKKWLILIDELFKGTNVQDAMKCSTAVIEGLRRMQNAVFILSTHLYEIGEPLQQYPNIQFRYFETHVQDDQLAFSYQLKEGISNDRLGYLILKREGVVDLLNKL